MTHENDNETSDIECNACGKTFASSPQGDDCVVCAAGPICSDCWVDGGMKCGPACEAARAGCWEVPIATNKTRRKS